MKIPNVGGVVRVFGAGKALVMAYRPEILFGASVVSTVSAVVLAAKGGYEARGIVDAEQARRDAQEQSAPMTVKEKAQLTWLCYMPAAITTVGALGSTTGLHIVHIKEKKALAAAALMAIEEVRTEAKQYVDDVMEAIDESTTEKGKEKIQKALDEKPQPYWMSDGEVNEKYLIRDPLTGRDIWASRAQIEEAIVEVGNKINGSGDCPLNEFWEQAGWGRLDLGEEMGWSGVIPSIEWTDQFGRPISGVRDDGRPWRGFRFLPEPEKGFDDPNR